MQKRIFLFLLAFAVVSCAKPQGDLAPNQGRTVIDRYHGDVNANVYGGVEPSRHVVNAPVDSVWSVLPQVYANLDIEPTSVDSRGYQVGNTHFVPREIEGRRLSRYIQCGYGVTTSNNADTYRVTMSVITRVRVDEDGQTLLQTELSASARPREVSGGAINCSSTGRLERRIAELASELLGSGDRTEHRPQH